MAVRLSSEQFAALLPDIRPSLLIFAERRTSPTVAEDMVSEAVFRALSRLETFDASGDEALIRWLRAILFKVCQEETGRRVQTVSLSGIAEPEGDPLDGMGAELDWAQAIRRLNSAKLTARQWSIMSMVDAGYTQREIAIHLRVTQAAVGQSVAAARVKIKAAEGGEYVRISELFREACRHHVVRKPVKRGVEAARRSLAALARMDANAEARVRRCQKRSGAVER